MAAPEMLGEFKSVLETIAGTKESIRQAKEWMLARPHEVRALARALREHVEAWASREHASGADRFNKILFAIYLLNEVFFNSGPDEPFRRGCLEQLPAVMAAATSTAPDQACRDKVSRVIDLWGTKNLFAPAEIAMIRSEPADSVAPASATALQQPQVPSALSPQGLAAAAAQAVAQHQAAIEKETTKVVLPQRCDLASVPVGVMAGLVKVALASGHPAWKPLDVLTMPTLMPPAVEPGRLEARVKEFYRVLEKDRAKRAGKRAAREKELEVDRSVAAVPVQAVGEESHLPIQHLPPDEMRRPYAQPAVTQAVANRADDAVKPIGDENLGKQMLRGMGWEEGRGLGVAGRGRAEPIAEAGQTDKIGIGSRKQEEELDIYAQYRTQRGSSYRSRWNS